MTKRAHRAPQRLPEPVTLDLPPADYQPSKAEIEQEFDMPGMTPDEMRKAFFRPFRIVRTDPKSG